MHPSLRFSYLNRLPMSSRRIAQAVCDDPSGENIDRFAALTAGMTASKLAEFEPVYYCLLDPTRIPSSEEFEASSPEIIYAIKWGVFVVGILFNVQVPPGAGVGLWPRVWSWVNFELLFHSVMGQFDISLPSEAELCISLITFSGHLSTHNPTHQVIASTPGFQGFVVRAWVFILGANSYDTYDTEARNAVIGDIFGFLDPTCFDVYCLA
ncbi:hypothetical protein C8R47DRAFT_1169370 [Mycena vitilis]|nr:hypothetical protein C8R47DRAFT_1169370 [Mycena vitilis]